MEDADAGKEGIVSVYEPTLNEHRGESMVRASRHEKVEMLVENRTLCAISRRIEINKVE